MSAENPARGSSEPLALFSSSLTGILLRLVGLALLDAFAMWFIFRLLDDGAVLLVVFVAIVTIGLNAIFLIEKLYPFRWFSPGLALMIIMLLYPTLFTVYTAFTNYSTGNILVKNQAIDLIKTKPEYRFSPVSYTWLPYRNTEGKYLLWLTSSETNETLIAYQDKGGANAPTPAEMGMEGVTVVENAAVGEAPVSIEGYQLLTPETALEALSGITELAYAAPYDKVTVGTVDPDADLDSGAILDPQKGMFADYNGRRPAFYNAFIFSSETQDIALWLAEQDDDGTLLLRPNAPVVINGIPQQIGDYSLLSRAQITRERLTEILPTLEFGAEDTPIRIDPNSADKAGQLKQRYTYQEADGSFVDSETGEIFKAIDGTFTSTTDPAKTLTPGYYTVIGLDNFDRLVSDQRLRGPFLRIFAWTIVHAFFAVFLTFCLGLGLAILMDDAHIPYRKVLRSLILIPYAIPAFISVLVWRGLLDPQLGLINHWTESLLGTSPQWLSNPYWAKIGILLVELWVGFPYMMLVCTGALQAIPRDIYEAAEVDGASSLDRFRTLTLPLLLVAVGPLLIASYAFNFNNFTNIELFNEGGPPIANSSVPAGHTDILITYTYAQAFGSGGGTDYAFASAISIFIFIVVAIITILNFQFTKRWENVYQSR